MVRYMIVRVPQVVAPLQLTPPHWPQTGAWAAARRGRRATRPKTDVNEYMSVSLRGRSEELGLESVEVARPCYMSG